MDFMVSQGFIQGKSTPCMFYHPVRDLRIVVHGGDFTVGGFAEDLDWFRRMISEKCEVKFRARLGDDPKDEKSVRILNRVLEWRNGFGILYEADQRHGDILVKELGLSSESKSVSTPGVKEVPDESVDFNPSMYRALVARANYLAQDRPDIQYAVKELCRKMSSPDSKSWMRLKRLGRYLVGEPREKLEFKFQDMPEELHVWVDTDHAGCRETRKSTSGGVMMMGSHCLKHWSTTQAVVSLSSGESEYYGIVRGAAQGFGMKSMWDDLGVAVKLVVNTDASAARGIAMRKGLGKVRHIEVNQLWVQDRVQRGELEIRKVSTNVNLADVLTKYVDRSLIDRHSVGMSCVSAAGRHELAPVIACVSLPRGAHDEGMSAVGLREDADGAVHGLVLKRTTSWTSVEGIPRPWGMSGSGRSVGSRGLTLLPPTVVSNAQAGTFSCCDRSVTAEPFGFVTRKARHCVFMVAERG